MATFIRKTGDMVLREGKRWSKDYCFSWWKTKAEEEKDFIKHIDNGKKPVDEYFDRQFKIGTIEEWEQIRTEALFKL